MDFNPFSTGNGHAAHEDQRIGSNGGHQHLDSNGAAAHHANGNGAAHVDGDSAAGFDLHLKSDPSSPLNPSAVEFTPGQLKLRAGSDVDATHLNPGAAEFVPTVFETEVPEPSLMASLGDAFSSVTQNVQQGLTGAANEAAKLAEEVGSSIEYGFKSAADSVETAYNSGISGVELQADANTEELETAGSAASDHAGSVIDQIENATNEVATSVENALETAAHGTSEAASEIASTYNNTVQDLSSTVESTESSLDATITSTQNTLNQAADGAGEEMEILQQDGTEFADQASANAGDSVNAFINTVNATPEDTSLTLQSGLNSVLESATSAFNTATTFGTGALQAAYDSTVDTLSSGDVDEHLLVSEPKLEEELSSVHLQPGTAVHLSGAEEAFDDDVPALVDANAEHADATIEPAVEQMGGALQQVGDFVSSAFDSVTCTLGEAAQMVSDSAQATQHAAADYAANISSKVSEGFDTIIKSPEEPDSVETPLQTGELSKIATELDGETVETSQSTADKCDEEVQDLADDGIEKASSFTLNTNELSQTATLDAGQALDDVAGGVEQASTYAQDIVDTVCSSTDAAAASFDGKIDTSSADMTRTLKEISDESKYVLDDDVEQIETATEKVDEVSDDVMDSVAAHVDLVETDVKASEESLLGQASDALNSGYDQLSSAFDHATECAQAAVDSVTEYLPSADKTLATENTLEGSIDLTPANEETDISKASNEEFLKTGLDAATSSLSDATSFISSGLQSVVDNTADTVGLAYESMADAVTSGLNAVAPQMSTTIVPQGDIDTDITLDTVQDDALEKAASDSTESVRGSEADEVDVSVQDTLDAIPRVDDPGQLAADSADTAPDTAANEDFAPVSVFTDGLQSVINTAADSATSAMELVAEKAHEAFESVAHVMDTEELPHEEVDTDSSQPLPETANQSYDVGDASSPVTPHDELQSPDMISEIQHQELDSSDIATATLEQEYECGNITAGIENQDYESSGVTESSVLIDADALEHDINKAAAEIDSLMEQAAGNFHGLQNIAGFSAEVPVQADEINIESNLEHDAQELQHEESTEEAEREHEHLIEHAKDTAVELSEHVQYAHDQGQNEIQELGEQADKPSELIETVHDACKEGSEKALDVIEYAQDNLHRTEQEAHDILESEHSQVEETVHDSGEQLQDQYNQAKELSFETNLEGQQARDVLESGQNQAEEIADDVVGKIQEQFNLPSESSSEHILETQHEVHDILESQQNLTEETTRGIKEKDEYNEGSEFSSKPILATDIDIIQPTESHSDEAVEQHEVQHTNNDNDGDVDQKVKAEIHSSPEDAEEDIDRAERDDTELAQTAADIVSPVVEKAVAGLEAMEFSAPPIAADTTNEVPSSPMEDFETIQQSEIEAVREEMEQDEQKMPEVDPIESNELLQASFHEDMQTFSQQNATILSPDQEQFDAMERAMQGDQSSPTAMPGGYVYHTPVHQPNQTLLPDVSIEPEPTAAENSHSIEAIHTPTEKVEAEYDTSSQLAPELCSEAAPTPDVVSTPEPVVEPKEPAIVTETTEAEPPITPDSYVHKAAIVTETYTPISAPQEPEMVSPNEAEPADEKSEPPSEPESAAVDPTAVAVIAAAAAVTVGAAAVAVDVAAKKTKPDTKAAGKVTATKKPTKELAKKTISSKTDAVKATPKTATSVANKAATKTATKPAPKLSRPSTAPVKTSAPKPTSTITSKTPTSASKPRPTSAISAKASPSPATKSSITSSRLSSSRTTPSSTSRPTSTSTTPRTPASSTTTARISPTKTASAPSASRAKPAPARTTPSSRPASASTRTTVTTSRTTSSATKTTPTTRTPLTARTAASKTAASPTKPETKSLTSKVSRPSTLGARPTPRVTSSTTATSRTTTTSSTSSRPAAAAGSSTNAGRTSASSTRTSLTSRSTAAATTSGSPRRPPTKQVKDTVNSKLSATSRPAAKTTGFGTTISSTVKKIGPGIGSRTTTTKTTTRTKTSSVATKKSAKAVVAELDPAVAPVNGSGDLEKFRSEEVAVELTKLDGADTNGHGHLVDEFENTASPDLHQVAPV